ncbi:hypothetical protein, partial [Acinetobacter baumannii]|uniref:hypothetical protein n=1 Tax=Acinetobacter baumannii TaxID=470 RepID=UPI001BB464BE
MRQPDPGVALATLFAGSGGASMGSQQAWFEESVSSPVGLMTGPQGRQLDRPLGQLFDEVPADWQPITAAFRASPQGASLM